MSHLKLLNDLDLLEYFDSIGISVFDEANILESLGQGFSAFFSDTEQTPKKKADVVSSISYAANVRLDDAVSIALTEACEYACSMDSKSVPPVIGMFVGGLTLRAAREGKSLDPEVRERLVSRLLKVLLHIEENNALLFKSKVNDSILSSEDSIKYLFSIYSDNNKDIKTFFERVLEVSENSVAGSNNIKSGLGSHAFLKNMCMALNCPSVAFDGHDKLFVLTKFSELFLRADIDVFGFDFSEAGISAATTIMKNYHLVRSDSPCESLRLSCFPAIEFISSVYFQDKSIIESSLAENKEVVSAFFEALDESQIDKIKSDYQACILAYISVCRSPKFESLLTNQSKQNRILDDFML